MTPARTATRWAAAALLAPCAAASELAESLWQPLDAMHGQLACAGAYVEPPTPLPRDVDSAAYPVELNARDLQSDIGVSSAIAGGVTLRQGNRLLTADAMDLDERASTARTRGALRLSEPGLHANAVGATVALAEDRASLADAAFVLTASGLRGTTTRLERRGGALALSQAALTRCPPGNNTWTMRSALIEIDQRNGLASARHVRLNVGRVPVFYAPYLRFPVREDRASGFLFPNIGYNNDDGIDVAVPYYLNLAPNYDATLTPRLIGDRGAGLEAEIRHLARRASNELGAALLPADDDYNGELSRADFVADAGAGPFVPADRWLLSAAHQGRIGGWRTLADFTAVSDNDYFIDLGSEIAVASRVSLQRRAEIQYARGGLFARLWAQGFQRLEPGLAPYRRLPEANVTYTGALVGPFAWSLGAAWASFERNVPARGIAAINGERLHVEPRLRLPLSRSWGFLNLSAGLRHTAYDLVGTPPDVAAAPTRNVRVASVDAGLFFERELGGGLIQTLEPRLYYLYQSYAEQDGLPRFDAAVMTFSFRQLFRDNRFAGLDRFGDAEQVAFGVTSRLLSATTGAERLTAQLGTIGYLSDRRVTLNGQGDPRDLHATSAVAGELRAIIGDFALTTTLAWDPRFGELDEAGFGLNFRRDSRRIVNVGYRRRTRTAVDQTDVSVYWPLTGRISAFGRWNHDWRFGQNIESFAGLEYASCCLAVKVAWHNTIDVPRNRLTPDADFDRGVVVQIVFRGLAGFGTKVDSRLERGIKGYRREEGYR